MLLSSRTVRLLFEAAETVGVSRDRLCDPHGIVAAEVADPSQKVEYSTLVVLLEELSRALGGDVSRLQAVGRAMTQTPSYEPLKAVARAVVSPRALYEVANRWVAPVNFPHLRLDYEFIGDQRMRLHGEIPPSYLACEPLFHVFEGSVVQLPLLLGLPPATVIQSQVTPRTFDALVEMPARESFVTRMQRGVRALVGAPGALRVLEDERKQLAENVEALKRAREDLRALLDRLPDLVVVHAAGKVLWANRAFLTALDFTLEDLVTLRLEDLVGHDPQARSLMMERMSKPADDPDLPAVPEVSVRGKLGREVVVEVAPAQAVVFEGVAARLVVGRDVTDRVHMRARLVVADRLASIGLLAAGVAHEVNNPLAYVLNNIEIARKELAPLGAATQNSRQALSVALEGVDRIRAIVRDLLKLSRGDDGPLTPMDLRIVVESTLALAAREIERTTRLVRDLRPAPHVMASDSRIAQVLLNLVNNALEAMRERPRDANLLSVRVAEAPEGGTLLEVSDTGTGIQPNDLPRLFEPFFTTKAAGQGTGLGLAIVHRIVVELGGNITVSSTPGEGTTFRVHLPGAIDSIR